MKTKKISNQMKAGPKYVGGGMKCTPNTSKLLKTYSKDCEGKQYK